MVKHWWAVLLVFGLAGSLTPASAQVLKGKTAETKSESTLKKSKQSHEDADAASKDARTNKTDRLKVQSVEGGHATDAAAKTSRKAGGDPQIESMEGGHATDAAVKTGRKAGGEQQTESMKTTNKNILADDANFKTKKSDAEHKQAATKNSRKAGKPQSEFLTITKKDILVSDVNQKGKKSGPQLKAMPQDAAKNARKQVDQASPK